MAAPVATQQPAPQQIAAQVAAGVDPRVAQFSAQQRQFLASMLANMQAHGGEDIRTPAALGTNLLAEGLLQYGLNKATKNQSAAQQRLAEALYPNNREAQLRWLVDPEGMNKAAAAGYAPIDVRQGNTILNAPGGGNYTAPVMWHDANMFGTQTPDSVSVTGQRGATIPEQTSMATQQEAARHNLAVEKIDSAKAAIEQGMLGVALRNANTSAGNLGLGQSNSPNFAPPPGFIIGHPGAQ